MEPANAINVRAVRWLAAALLFCSPLAFAASRSDSPSRDSEIEKGLALYREAALIMRAADELARQGRSEEALQMYEDLCRRLVRFKEENPYWNNAVTRRKIAACRRKIGVLSKRRKAVWRDRGRGVLQSMRALLERAKEIEREELRSRGEAAGEPTELKESAPPAAAEEGGKTTVARAVRPPLSAEETEKAVRRAKELRLRGMDGEALMILEDTIAAFPEQVGPYLERADFFLDKKKYERAVKDYRTALSLGGSSGTVHYGLGTAYAKLAEELEAKGEREEATDRYRDAIEEYKESVWRDCGYAPAYYGLGCVYSRLGMREDAIYYFRKTLERAEEGSDLARRASYNMRLLGGY